MNLIGFIADLHLRGKDLDAGEQQLRAAVQLCIDRRVRVLAIAGDVFDRPSIGDQHASTGAIASVAIDALSWATQHGVEVLVIPGNHDASGAGSVAACAVLEGIRGVDVCHEPTALTLAGVRFVCLPWLWDGRSAEHEIEALIEHSPAELMAGRSVLLAHVQVVGASMGAVACEFKPGAFQVRQSFLARLPFDRIALGDFHRRQDLAGGRGGYVGAIRQLSHGEEGNPAGIELWDSETGAAEWIEIEEAPRYRTVVLLPDEQAPRPRPDELMRVQYERHRPDPVECARLEAAGVQVEIILDREERVRRADVPEGVMQRPHDLIRLWAAAQHPPIEGERLTAMLATFDELGADRPMPPEPEPEPEDDRPEFEPAPAAPVPIASDEIPF